MKIIYGVIMTLMAISCRHQNEAPQNVTIEKTISQDIQMTDSAVQVADEEERNSNTEQKQKSPPAPQTTAAEPKVDWTQKIIKTANLSVELKDYHAFNNNIHHTLASYGAYIAQEQQQESDAQITNDVSIKVPVDQFENLLNFISADKKNKILQKQISSSDVTSEYADIKAREETKRQVRAKYQQFLSNAHKIDDVLQLQSEINSITEDIEAAASRVKYLSHQSAYSTINLHYFQVLDASKVDEDKSPGFGTQFVQALKSGSSIIGDLIIILVSIWPLLIVGCIAWYLFRRSNMMKPRTSQLSKGQE